VSMASVTFPYRYYWKFLEHKPFGDAKTRSEPKSRVVLVHGWQGSHLVWLSTAEWLQRQGHDVVVLDLLGWGQSNTALLPAEATSPSSEVRCPTTARLGAPLYASQVRDCVERVGWQDKPIVLAGKSMGAAVCQEYTNRYPHVGKLVLLCPAGSKEPVRWMLPNIASWLARLLLGRHRPLQWLRYKVPILFALPKFFFRCWSYGRKAKQHLHLLTTTPEYEVHPDTPRRLVHDLGIPTIVFQGKRDWLHHYTACRYEEVGARVVHYEKGHLDLCNSCGDWESSDFLPSDPDIWLLPSDGE